MGISDEESWFRNDYLPSGHATGWRRYVARVLVGFVVCGVLLGLIVVLAVR